MIQHTGTTETHSLETETALIELRERAAEVQAFARDFLMVSSTTNQADMEAFIHSLRGQGFSTDIPAVHQAVATMIMELDYRVQHESTAATAMPQSWTEREALRRFEEVRSTLRDRLENILASSHGRGEGENGIEQEGRDLDLDLRVPSVSGRLHALFDLHIEIAESQALHDPVVQRRQRMMRILHRGAVHMAAAERMTIERLEETSLRLRNLFRPSLNPVKMALMKPNRRWSSASLKPRAMRSTPAPCVLASLLAQASWGLNLATSHPARSHALHRASW